jgi:hypothetical protein
MTLTALIVTSFWLVLQSSWLREAFPVLTCREANGSTLFMRNGSITVCIDALFSKVASIGIGFAFSISFFLTSRNAAASNKERLTHPTAGSARCSCDVGANVRESAGLLFRADVNVPRPLRQLQP